jgi:hypothetical protein
MIKKEDMRKNLYGAHLKVRDIISRLNMVEVVLKYKAEEDVSENCDLMRVLEEVRNIKWQLNEHIDRKLLVRR